MDAVITDYSSVCFDYLLLNGPVACSIDDYNQYCINKLKEVFENHQIEFWEDDKAIYDWNVNLYLLWLKDMDKAFSMFLGLKYAMRD